MSTLAMFSKFGRLIPKLNTLNFYICCGDKCFKAEFIEADCGVQLKRRNERFSGLIKIVESLAKIIRPFLTTNLLKLQFIDFILKHNNEMCNSCTVKATALPLQLSVQHRPAEFNSSICFYTRRFCYFNTIPFKPVLTWVDYYFNLKEPST